MDNNLVASAGDNDTIKLWDLQNDTMVPFRGHTAKINSIAFSPDGNLLASGSADQTVRLWDIRTQQNIATFEHITDRWNSEIQTVAFSPDGQLLAIGDRGRDVILWNIHTQKEIATLQRDGAVYSLAFSPNGQFLAAGGGFGVTVWDVAERKVITALDRNHTAERVVFPPDGQTLASVNHQGAVYLWAVPDWTPIAVLPNSGSGRSLDITSDNKLLVVTTGTGTYLWSLETGQRIAVAGGWAYGVSFSPDGQRLASCYYNGTVRVENIAAYRQIELPDRFIVKLFYFLPNDRRPQSDFDTNLDRRIKAVQHAFAEQMAHHGFGRKTFTYETDASGKAVVHHIKGQRNAAFYEKNPLASSDFLGWNLSPVASTALPDQPHKPATPEDIHIVFLEVSSEELASSCRTNYIFTDTVNNDRGGIIPAQGDCVSFHHITWMLGNAFGLPRDSIMRFSAAERIELSYAAAEWLDAHRYFNANPTGFNVPPTIEMLKPRAALTGSLHLSFKITDPDGLHQAQLRIPEPNNELLYLWGQMIGYKSLRGETENIRFTDIYRIYQGVSNHQ